MWEFNLENEVKIKLHCLQEDDLGLICRARVEFLASMKWHPHYLAKTVSQIFTYFKEKKKETLT